MQALASPANISKLIYNSYKILNLPVTVTAIVLHGIAVMVIVPHGVTVAVVALHGVVVAVVAPCVVSWSRPLHCGSRDGCHRAAWCCSRSCCAVWCYGHGCHTVYGVVVMAIAPCGVVVMVGVIVLRGVAVTVGVLHDAAVVVTVSLLHIITIMPLPSR